LKIACLPISPLGLKRLLHFNGNVVALNRQVTCSRGSIFLYRRDLVNRSGARLHRNLHHSRHRQIDDARLLRLVSGQYGQRQTAGKKQRGENGSSASKRIAATSPTEQSLRTATSERCAHIGTLALLNKDKDHDGKGHQ